MYQPPSPEQLKTLRKQLKATQNQMADLCGFPHVFDKRAGKELPNAGAWRALTAPPERKGSRRIAPDVLIHLAANALLAPEMLETIHAKMEELKTNDGLAGYYTELSRPKLMIIAIHVLGNVYQSAINNAITELKSL